MEKCEKLIILAESINTLKSPVAKNQSMIANLVATSFAFLVTVSCF